MALIFFGKTVSWYFIWYIVVCLFLGITMVNFVMKRNQMVAGALLFALLTLTFVFYGLRWFTDYQLKGTASASPVCTSGDCTWPPIINLCPDYMVTWSDSTGKMYCYDVLNLYNMKTAPGNPAYAMVGGLTINTFPNQSAYLIFDPSAGKTDPGRYPLIAAMKTANGTLTDPNAKNMRWEGVWDGKTTANVACIPTADGATVAKTQGSTCT